MSKYDYNCISYTLSWVTWEWWHEDLHRIVKTMEDQCICGFWWVMLLKKKKTMEPVVREWNPWSWEEGMVIVAGNGKVWSHNGREELRKAAEQNHLSKQDQRVERLRNWEDYPTCLNLENFGMKSIRRCDIEPGTKILQPWPAICDFCKYVS